MQMPEQLLKRDIAALTNFLKIATAISSSVPTVPTGGLCDTGLISDDAFPDTPKSAFPCLALSTYRSHNAGVLAVDCRPLQHIIVIDLGTTKAPVSG